MADSGLGDSAKLRSPIVTVLGHIDHGKTSLLDKMRGTAVQDREAAGITQHIGASFFPTETIESICGDLLKSTKTKLTIDGLLFIDTPGHEAYLNLRRRGGAIADIAILVVDIRITENPAIREDSFSCSSKQIRQGPRMARKGGYESLSGNQIAGYNYSIGG
jgi:translation elongation factor EF-Tu-like GTPase